MKAVHDAMAAMLPAGTKCYSLDPVLSKPPAASDYPYVLLWGSPGEETSGDELGDSLGDQIAGFDVTVRATYVGLNADALSKLIAKCRTAWNRKAPTIDGFLCSALKQSALVDAQADTSLVVLSKYPVYAVDQYRLVGSKT